MQWVFFPKKAKWTGLWQPPGPEELAEQIKRLLPELPEIVESVQNQRRTPAWKKELVARAVKGTAAEMDLFPITEPDMAVEDLFAFFGIPPEVHDLYFRDAETQRERAAAENELWADVIVPMFHLFTVAFEGLKGDLPGWFTIEYNREADEFVVLYAEAGLQPRSKGRGLPSPGQR
jgi:hypothetical protein